MDTDGGTSMLRTLVGKIAEIWNAPDQWIEAERAEAFPELEAATPHGAFRSQFLDLARDRQRENGKLVASLITIVWTDAPEGEATRYRDMKALTAMVVEVVLEQMAGRPDICLQYDADNAVICFASGNRLVMELRTAMMAQALRAALGQRMAELAERVRIEFVVQDLDPVDAVAGGTDPAAALVELLGGTRKTREPAVNAA